MKKIFLYLGFALLAIMISNSSCKKDDNNNNDPNKPDPLNELRYLNIANAKSLVIVGSAGKSTHNGNKLFKVTDDGAYVEVSYFDENGNTITTNIYPISMYNLSDNYLTITFAELGTFLVRKSDGAVFTGSKLPQSFPVPWIYSRSDLFIQEDVYGNIYYLYNQQVIKLNVTNPDELTVSTYSASGDQVDLFVIDNSGNMAYMHGGSNRFKYVSGQLVNLHFTFEWTDINNAYIYGRNPEGGVLNIVRIIPDPFGIENYGDTNFTVNCLGYLVKIKNKNIVVGEGCGYVYELFNISENPNKYPVSHFDPSIGAIKYLAASDNYYYILAKNNQLQSMLLKVDPTNGHSSQNLVTTGEFDIYFIVVKNSDEVQFYALRMSDGKRVLAEIDSEGNINILAELDDDSVIALEKIN